MRFFRIDFGGQIGNGIWDILLNRIELGIGSRLDQSTLMKLAGKITRFKGGGEYDDEEIVFQVAT